MVTNLSIGIKPIPSTPTIIRDSVFLISSSLINNNCYKDGILIDSSSNKIKPSNNGSYTLRTVGSSCLSISSIPYYFLVTDVINLSSNEFIKLAPNPVKNQINIDFVIKGYQRLNINFYELSTGLLKYSNKGVFAGSQLYLGQLSPGIYVVSVSSEDGKISHKLKVIKL